MLCAFSIKLILPHLIFSLTLLFGCLSILKLVFKLDQLLLFAIYFNRKNFSALVKLSKLGFLCLDLLQIIFDFFVKLSILVLDFISLIRHFNGDLALLVDIFLSQVYGALDTLDIFVGPV